MWNIFDQLEKYMKSADDQHEPIEMLYMEQKSFM